MKKLLLMILFLSFIFNSNKAEALLISPTEDSGTYSYWTAGGFGPSVSTPIATSIQVYDFGGKSYFWTKFDLSLLPESSQITSAILNVNIYWHIDNLALNYEVGSYYVEDDNWNEPLFQNDAQGITWNTQPDITTQPTDSVLVTHHPDWFEWDVTQAVQSALDDDEILTLVLRFTQDTYPDPGPGHQYANVAVIEDTEFLDIEVLPAPVPEPATILLFGLGILGLAGVKGRKK